MLDSIPKAIFSIWAKNPSGIPRGSAFAIARDLFVTCAHVVSGASKILIVSEEPIFNGENTAEASVKAVDERLDLALLTLQRFQVASFLGLSAQDQPDDSIPLLVWAWPTLSGENQPLSGENQPLFRCTSRAAVVTGFWPGKDKCPPSFSFAGHVEEGMSGGPVISALSAEVVGIVTQRWNIDPTEVAENWKGNLEGRGFYDFSGSPAPNDIVEAQLSLGIGRALPVNHLRDFVSKTFQPIRG